MSVIQLAILAPDSRSAERLRGEAEACEGIEVALLISEWTHLDPQSLVRRLQQSEPEVVLIDFGSREESFAFIETLKQGMDDVRVLATASSASPEWIIKAVQMGAREFLPPPVQTAVLQEAFNRYRRERQSAQAPPQHKGELFAVTAAKGGSGATSVAINLAASIAQLPSTNVSLIDLSQPIGDAATYLDVNPRYTISDAFEAGDRLDPVMLESLMGEREKVSLLAGPRHFAAKAERNGLPVGRLLSTAREAFSHAVVDLGSPLEEDALKQVFDNDGRLLIVLTPELTTLWRTRQVLEFVGVSPDDERVRLVLNREEKKSAISLKEIESTLDRKIDWTLPNDYRCCLEAIHAGRPLVHFNHSQLSHHYSQMAIDLTGLKPRKDRRGLFGFLGGGSSK
ncbi:MAG TPA: hypothetical protein VLV83_18390 [Acidobacteriota bacterium]|nr:hypothetical protein [Acidobacteriota bacterium]